MIKTVQIKYKESVLSAVIPGLKKEDFVIKDEKGNRITDHPFEDVGNGNYFIG